MYFKPNFADFGNMRMMIMLRKNNNLKSQNSMSPNPLLSMFTKKSTKN